LDQSYLALAIFSQMKSLQAVIASIIRLIRPIFQKDRFTLRAIALVLKLEKKIKISSLKENKAVFPSIYARRGRGNTGTFAHPILAAAYAGRRYGFGVRPSSSSGGDAYMPVVVVVIFVVVVGLEYLFGG